MKIVVENIMWDATGEELKSLPQKIDIMNPKTSFFENTDENIADYLSNEYGFCVYGFNYYIFDVNDIPFKRITEYSEQIEFVKKLFNENKQLARLISNEYDILSRMEDVKNEIDSNNDWNKIKFSEDDIREIAENAEEKIADYYCNWQLGCRDAIIEHIEEKMNIEEDENVE